MCISIYLYICIYTCVYIYIYTYIHTYIHVQTVPDTSRRFRHLLAFSEARQNMSSRCHSVASALGPYTDTSTNAGTDTDTNTNTNTDNDYVYSRTVGPFLNPAMDFIKDT